MFRRLSPSLPYALLVSCLALAVIPAARAQETGAVGATATEEAPLAGRVEGSKVNVRAGPGTSFPDVARLDRDAPLLILGRDSGWVRVRLPGGAPLFVFHTLVEHEEGALHASVTATNVLLRGTPSKAHLALHDQRLQPGDRVVVLGTETDGDGGVWLRILPPERVSFWVHERYVREAGAPESIAEEFAERRLARRDELSGGRTKVERERVARESAERFEATIAPYVRRADGGVVLPEHVAAAEKLLDVAPDEAARARVVEVVAALRERMEELARAEEEARARQVARDEAARARAAEEEARRAREAEEARRRREAEALKDTTAAGRVVLREGRAYLVDGGTSLRLTSKRFRLADFEGRRVSVRGERVKAKAGADQVVFVVEHLEVLRTKREGDGPERDGD